jgi:hypothetical protein
MLNNYRKMAFRTIILIALALVPAASHAKDIYVSVSGSGLRSGSDWKNAVDNRSFALMLLSASPGDVFHLAEGTYIPYFDDSGRAFGSGRTKTFLIRSGVSVRGGYDADGNTIAGLAESISAVQLTGSFGQNTSRGSNACHVVSIAAGASPVHAASLHRLTVAGGYAYGGLDNSKGAGIYIAADAGGGSGKAVNISHVCISGNMATGEGAGIYIGRNASVKISHSQIAGNTRITSSDLWGGGIYIDRASLDISDSRLENNTAGRGGAIRAVSGHLSSTRCVYANNSVESRGGAIEMSRRSAAIFRSDSIAGNTAALGGGIISESRSEIRLSNCVLTGNTAGGGGGMYNSGDSKAEIDSCIIERNRAERGGGIDNRGQMRAATVRITGNTASHGNGGGVFQSGTLVATGSEISGNTAVNGGGIYTENSSATISVTSISGNTATDNGGGIYHRSGKCELNYATVAGNAAPAGKSSGICAVAYPAILSSIIAGNSGADDFAGGKLHGAGTGSSHSNIIGNEYFDDGNRAGQSVPFNASKHLGTLAFNRGAFTRTHALTWKGSPADNPAIGMAQYIAEYPLDQTGSARHSRYPSLGAYEEPFFRAYGDHIYAGSAGDSVNILANDAYGNCSPRVILLSKPKLGTCSITGDSIFAYTPNAGAKGIDTLWYRLECPGGLRDSAIITVNTGMQYDHPQNIRDEAVCMEDMPPVNFKVSRKIVNDKVGIDGFSIPLVGDLNGDGKPEIVGLGVVSISGGEVTGLSASGKSIVIYDGQTGETLLNFDLNTLGNNKYTDNTGYGTRYGFHLRYEPRHNSYSHLAIADLDSDGIGEIIVAETGSGMVYALKPSIDDAGTIVGMTMMWEADVLHNHPHINQTYSVSSAHKFGAPVPYVSDLNGDGIPEVIVYNKIYNGITGTLELELETLEDFSDPGTSSLAYARCSTNAYVGRLPGADNHDDWIPVMAINDLDGDGIMEIAAGSKIYKPLIFNPNSTAGNSFSITKGPESVSVNRDTYYLTDGFTVVADIDGDNVTDIIVVKRHINRTHFLIYVWDPRMSGNSALKAVMAVKQNSYTGHFSVPFVGDINGRMDGWKNGTYSLQLPEICLTMGELDNTTSYPVSEHHLSKFPEYTAPAFTGNDGSRQHFYGHVVAFTYDAGEPDISKRLKLSWMMKHSDGSHQTGIVMFDFDADGIDELVYRDEMSLRVISSANRADSLDFVNLKMDEVSHPSVIRFRETGVSSYTGLECPVVADVNGDGSADIITFGYQSSSSTNSSGGHLLVYEAAGESWAPARPVWNQGIYYPLQINDDLSVPRHPQSTLTKYYSKLPHETAGDTIQPFNGNWIQQPVVRSHNYVPIMMKPDPSLPPDSIRITSSSATETGISLYVENRGEASANSNTPITFYHSSIDVKNKIETFAIGKDIFPGETAKLDCKLKGDFRDMIIYARVLDAGDSIFPARGYFDCDISNNVSYTMQVSAIDDRYTLAAGSLTYLDISKNDIYRRSLKPEIYITESAGHGVSLLTADSLISYMPDAGFQGIDTIRYRIQCTYNNVVASDEATVYILVLQPSSLAYQACPGASIRLEVKPLAGVRFDWYGVETGGSVLPGGSDTAVYTHVKGSADETLWVQATVPNFNTAAFPRYRFDLPLAANCGSAAPSGCMADGTLLFREDFGGNMPSDKSTVDSCIAEVKGYACSKQYADNSYTLRKMSGGQPNWLDSVGDHTHPADSLRGYMIQFKTTGAAGDFYEYLLDGLCEGSKLYFSAWIAGVVKAPSSGRASLKFSVEDMNGNVIAAYYTGGIDDSSPVWKNYGFPFTVPHRLNSAVLRISGNGSGNSSFAMDDIAVHLCVPRAVLSDSGNHEVCENAVHSFRGQYTDDGSFGNSLTYRFEFRENPGSMWQPVEEDTLANPVDTGISLAVRNSGYYRFIAGRKDIIDCKNCVAVSNEIYLETVKCNRLVRDSVLVAFEGSAVFDVLANDTLSCGKPVLFDTVDGSGLHLGSLVKNPDSTFTYTAGRGVSGIDSVRYLITCHGITDTGRVYIFVNRLVPLHYACAGDSLRIGFPAVSGLRYVWYDSIAGGSPVGGVLRDSLSLVKGGSADIGRWWIQPEWNGITFPRFAISLLQADNCGTTVPSGCLADGTLLFRDDSAGNSGTSGQFYSTRIDGLCEGSRLLFSARIAGTPNAAAASRSSLIFTLEDTAGNIHAAYTCPVSAADTVRKSYGFAFTVPKGHSSLLLKIRNSTAGSGSFVMDSVEIRLCAPRVRIDGISDTLVCIGQKLVLSAGYPEAGNPFGDSVDFRWEFRHIDSAARQTLHGQAAAVPLNVSWIIDSIGRDSEGYYRLLLGKRGAAGSRNCCAASDPVRVRVVNSFKAADIRIQLSPEPGRLVNLSSFIDSIEYTGVKWTGISAGAPAILAGTDETTGSVNSSTFVGNSTLSYKYMLRSQCGSSEAKVYVRTLGNRIYRTPDTIAVCHSHESSSAVYLNRILGLELGGTWKYDSSINPDSTVADNMIAMSAPSKYAGMMIFNAAKAWKTAPKSYGISYRGHSNAKMFKFVYHMNTGPNGFTEKELVIVVTD